MMHGTRQNVFISNDDFIFTFYRIPACKIPAPEQNSILEFFMHLHVEEAMVPRSIHSMNLIMIPTVLFDDHIHHHDVFVLLEQRIVQRTNLVHIVDFEVVPC